MKDSFVECYKATLDFLKTPIIWIAIVLSTGILNFGQIVQLLSLCQ